MQESVKTYADELRRSEGVSIQIRVGLNSGEVVVRSIGGDLHMEYTAVGHTTHVAARMEQIAAPGTILISPATLRLVEGYVTVKSLGSRPIRGLETPLEVHEIIGGSAVRSRFHAAASRGLSRFIGRDIEIEQLLQALERAHRGQGQVVALVGQPGVGKSRLVWELIGSRRTNAALKLEAGCVPYGTATPWLPAVELVKEHIGIKKGDDSATIRDKLTARLRALDGDQPPMASALLSLLDIAPNDPAWAALGSFERRQQTIDAVKRLLLKASQERPRVIVVEDLQWIDSASQALLDSVVRDLSECRLLVLVTYRPEYRHTWGWTNSVR
jgi:hypothetical protein